MTGFVLERLVRAGWCLTGEVYWTRQDAELNATKMLRQKVVRRVRILPVHGDPVAVGELPAA